MILQSSFAAYFRFSLQQLIFLSITSIVELIQFIGRDFSNIGSLYDYFSTELNVTKSSTVIGIFFSIYAIARESVFQGFCVKKKTVFEDFSC